MEVRRREDEQVPLLLRVGLGVVWVYEGLVPKLLAPSPDLLSLVARFQPLPGAPEASSEPRACSRSCWAFS